MIVLPLKGVQNEHWSEDHSCWKAELQFGCQLGVSNLTLLTLEGASSLAASLDLSGLFFTKST